MSGQHNVPAQVVARSSARPTSRARRSMVWAHRIEGSAPYQTKAATVCWRPDLYDLDGSDWPVDAIDTCWTYVEERLPQGLVRLTRVHQQPLDLRTAPGARARYHHPLRARNRLQFGDDLPCPWMRPRSECRGVSGGACDRADMVITGGDQPRPDLHLGSAVSPQPVLSRVASNTKPCGHTTRRIGRLMPAPLAVSSIRRSPTKRGSMTSAMMAGKTQMACQT